MTDHIPTSTADDARRPVAEFRYGSVRATVWANQGGYGQIYSLKISRSYTKDGEWAQTNYLGRNDIFKAIQALTDAGRFVFGDSAGSPPDAPGQGDDEPPPENCD